MIVTGSILGSVAGLGAWILARLFSERNGAERTAPRAPFKSVAWSAILSIAGMTIWGTYLGWQSLELGLITAGLAFAGLLVAISLVDLSVQRIPNLLVLVLLLGAGAQAVWLGYQTLMAAALGFLVGGGLFLLAARLRRGAMGAGDVKLAAALGAVLGFPHVFSGLLAGVLAGGIASLWLLTTHRASRTDLIPYAPYLSIGALLVWTRSAGLWP